MEHNTTFPDTDTKQSVASLEGFSLSLSLSFTLTLLSLSFLLFLSLSFTLFFLFSLSLCSSCCIIPRDWKRGETVLQLGRQSSPPPNVHLIQNFGLVSSSPHHSNKLFSNICFRMSIPFSLTISLSPYSSSSLSLSTPTRTFHVSPYFTSRIYITNMFELLTFSRRKNVSLKTFEWKGWEDKHTKKNVLFHSYWRKRKWEEDWKK